MNQDEFKAELAEQLEVLLHRIKTEFPQSQSIRHCSSVTVDGSDVKVDGVSVSTNGTIKKQRIIDVPQTAVEQNDYAAMLALCEKAALEILAEKEEDIAGYSFTPPEEQVYIENWGLTTIFSNPDTDLPDGIALKLKLSERGGVGALAVAGVGKKHV